MSAKFSGSMTRCLGVFAATIFISASASQNAPHGWSLGLRTSEITATIFAAASMAGAIMAPIALGYPVKPEALSPWLVLLSVIFFELGAAASLIVVGALPNAAREEKPNATAAVMEEKALEPVAEADDKKAVGRKRSRALDEVAAKIKNAGGTLEGSMEDIGRRLGLSKSSAHRALHVLAGTGAISLATSAAGTLVQLRSVG